MLLKAVLRTIRVEAMATKPINAMKMSEVEKLDQVSIECFVTVVSIARATPVGKGGLPYLGKNTLKLSTPS